MMLRSVLPDSISDRNVVYALAWSILGNNFIAPEEVVNARPGIIYTDEQITTLAESIPSADILRWCMGNGYAVVPAPATAMSLLDVRELKKADFYSKHDSLYADQEFARKDKTSFGWLAIRKAPVPKSTNCIWRQQLLTLSAIERVPNAAEMSWFVTTYFEVRGTRLFKNVCVRTSSFDSNDNIVRVGFFKKGLYIGYWRGDRRYSYIGLSAARKNDA